VSERIAPGDGGIVLRVVHNTVEVHAQRPPRSLCDLRPVRRCDFQPAGTEAVPIAVMQLGETALVGPQAELSGKTGLDIKAGSPFDRTIVMTMVNGGAKYMADAASYDKITYAAMNSRYARRPGGAGAGLRRAVAASGTRVTPGGFRVAREPCPPGRARRRRMRAGAAGCGPAPPDAGRVRAPIIGRVVQHRSTSRNGKVPAGAAERILRAAMREFARHGFAGARVERILKRANVSPRSLYYHFGSKQGLYDAVRERLRAQHFQDFVHGVTDEPLVDRLLANIDVAMTPRWQQWSRMLMWEALDGGDDSAPYPEGTVPGDLLAFRAAQERGEIDEEIDPHVLTLAFTAMTFWPVMFPKSTRRLTEGMPEDQLLDERKKLIRALVRHLGSHAPSQADEQLTDA